MANLKSVQKGVFTLAATETVATETIPTAVNPYHTILFKGGVKIGDEGDRPSYTNIMVSLTDANTITFERTDSRNVEVKVSWYLVEFNSGVHVQRRIQNFTGQSDRSDELDNTTNLSNSFCLISYQTEGNNFGPDDFCRARLLEDSGQKKIEMFFDGATEGKVDWQVVEITDGGSVQSGSKELRANEDSVNDGLAPNIDLSKSFLIFSYKVSGEGNPDALAIRGHISAANQLTFARNANNSPISANISWFVVEMTDGTTVQQKDITLAAGTENGDTTIDPVTIDETSVHIGSLQQFGKNERNADEFGKAMITVGLDAEDNVHHERGQANSAAGIWTFYVVNWAKGGNTMNGVPEEVKTFAKGVKSPRRSTKRLENLGLEDDGTAKTHVLITESDPNQDIEGTFISGAISVIRTNARDVTAIFELDSNIVIETRFSNARNMGLGKDNPYGVVYHEFGDVQTLTFGFAIPLFFRENMELRIKVENNPVPEAKAIIIWGRDTDVISGPPSNGGDPPYPE